MNEAVSSSPASEEKASMLVLHIRHVALLLGGGTRIALFFFQGWPHVMSK